MVGMVRESLVFCSRRSQPLRAGPGRGHERGPGGPVHGQRGASVRVGAYPRGYGGRAVRDPAGGPDDNPIGALPALAVHVRS
eukprot:442942-Pyramimonas_sp.AAC.2